MDARLKLKQAITKTRTSDYGLKKTKNVCFFYFILEIKAIKATTSVMNAFATYFDLSIVIEGSNSFVHNISHQ